MKTNYQMLLDFEPFKFRKWGFINKNETEIVKKNFKIEERTDIELQNLRDFVVMYYTMKEKEDIAFNDSLKEKDKNLDNTLFELMDKMSAIVAVIDEEKFKRGLEV